MDREELLRMLNEVAFSYIKFSAELARLEEAVMLARKVNEYFTYIMRARQELATSMCDPTHNAVHYDPVLVLYYLQQIEHLVTKIDHLGGKDGM